MTEQFCAVLVTACLDVCAGICLDFMSLRMLQTLDLRNISLTFSFQNDTGNGCTENLCKSSCCKSRPVEGDRYEREALLSGQRTQIHQPATQPTMQATPR